MISNDIIEKAKALNTEAAELNEKRKQAEWAKKKAEEDLNKALIEYNRKYNTKIGVADIEKEYAAIEMKVKAQIAKVESEIEAVKNGATEVIEIKKTEIEKEEPVETENTVAFEVAESSESENRVKNDDMSELKSSISDITDTNDNISNGASDKDDEFDFSKYLS